MPKKIYIGTIEGVDEKTYLFEIPAVQIAQGLVQAMDAVRRSSTHPITPTSL